MVLILVALISDGVENEFLAVAHTSAQQQSTRQKWNFHLALFLEHLLRFNFAKNSPFKDLGNIYGKRGMVLMTCVVFIIIIHIPGEK